MRKLKENWKVYLTGLVGLVLGAVLVINGTAYAFGGLGKGEGGGAIQEALENEDYNAWKEAVNEKCPANQIDESEFEKLTEAHRLAQEGKYEEARQIKEELGLKGHEMKKGHGKGFGMSDEEHEAIWQALENNDYNAWKEAMGDRKMAGEIDESEFAKLVEAHNLRKEGQFTEASEIMEELGLRRGHK